MKKNKVLETQINEITLDSLSKLLLSESNLTVAVCNANSLVRACLLYTSPSPRDEL